MPNQHIFAPYCLCPLGAHLDHQNGPVTGFALDKGIDISYTPTDDGTVELHSLSFSTVVTFNIRQPIGEKQNDWGDYLRGVAWVMAKSYKLERGVTGTVNGSMPSGGIGSSAALLCAFVGILAQVNDLSLTDQQIIDITSKAERLYIGLSNGILDQSCVTYCKRNHLMFLDTLTGEQRLIPFGGNPDKEVPFKIAVFYSGVTRSLVNTDYNLRVEECRAAAWMLQAYENRRLNRLELANLRQVNESTFEKFGKMMPARFASRARHFYTECERVAEGINAWEEGDIEHFGELMFESCESSILNYECGSAELKTIYMSLRNCDGVYGARFCGSGFIGSCFALIDPEKEGQVHQQVTRDFLVKFPLYRDACRSFLCCSYGGIRFL